MDELEKLLAQQQQAAQQGIAALGDINTGKLDNHDPQTQQLAQPTPQKKPAPQDPKLNALNQIRNNADAAMAQKLPPLDNQQRPIPQNTFPGIPNRNPIEFDELNNIPGHSNPFSSDFDPDFDPYA